MATREVHYPIAPKGLATSFTESEMPPTYALKMRNRFINVVGGAEKRPGMERLGSGVPGLPNLTGTHELVKSDGSVALFVSGSGKVYRYDSGSWTQVHSGLDASSTLRSEQMGARLIFHNGVDRDFYTEDGATFQDLLAIIEQGTLTGAVSAGGGDDAEIDSWITDTNVVENDILYNVTKGAYAVITVVSASAIQHSIISTAAAATGIGVATSAQETGDIYKIIDTVELNIVPTDGEPDNVAVIGGPSSATGIYVTAVSDWTETAIRVGDFISNTTRVAVTQVTAITTAALRCVGVSGQTAGDSIVLLKSAMPISKAAHVHFGRRYSVDARDQRLIRISGPNDPQDMTAGAGTLDSNVFSFGSQQAEGDTAVALTSYQRFMVMAGQRNLYLFQGTDPVADVSGGATNFEIIGFFPHGVKSPDSLVSIGNDAVLITHDGAQSISMVGDASTLGRANLSEAIKATLRDELNATPSSEIQVFHYPQRSWLCLKVGSVLYVFNYTPYLGRDQLAGGEPTTNAGSWSKFDGKFARQNYYFVRRDGTLIACGPNGAVYQFDTGVFTDDGETYTTEYQTGWLTTTEPRRSVRTRQGHYIKPVFEVGANISYTVRAEAGLNNESTDTITIDVSAGSPIGLAIVGTSPVGGSGTQDQKHPLRWRGEQVRLSFKTEDARGPDLLARFTLYVSDFGKR